MSTRPSDPVAPPSGRRVPVAPLLLAALLLVVVAVLSLAVARGWSPLWSTDLAVEPAVHRWAVGHPGAVVVADVVTTLGSPLAMNVLTVVLAVGAWFTGRRATAIAVVAVRGGALIAETALKALIDRPRPSFDPPLATATSSSFPSGHSAGTAAVVGFLALTMLAAPTDGWRRVGAARRRGPTLVAVAALAVFVLAVPASRVVLGVHYPSDVLGGLFLGLSAACLGRGVVASVARPDTGSAT